MKYLEFIFRTQPCTETVNDVLTALLADAGFESFTEHEAGLAAYVQASMYDEAAVDNLLRDFPIADTHITYTKTEAEDRDWNEEWERNYFKPIVIGDRCVVHGTFHKDVPKADYDIVINPQMAFGTGHHETTGLIMNKLLDVDLTGKTVLDMGCGTAILAILARMRGAKHCLAIDIDDWCVRNSLENIALNHMNGITVKQGDASILEGEGEFDLIIANINRNILLNDIPRYVRNMRRGSALYLSGFYTNDIPVLEEMAEQYGLQPVQTVSKRKWAMATFIRI
ncbi:MAG: 50S ribosomal protein L11 methyltransferase [Mediterranea sp.]|jgi:ribosomal protein L11 methyltransferase|nr:50S ribosomal protein L11 methyltransferase [Mediterranea sp.]